MLQCELGKAITVANEEYRRREEERVAGPRLGSLQGSSVIIGRVAQFDRFDRKLQALRRHRRNIDLGGSIDVPEHDRTGNVGDRLLQQFEALAGQLGLPEKDPGDVASRSREAPDIAERDRVVVDRYHDDRDRAGGLFRRLQHHLLTGSEDHVYLATDQLFHRFRKALDVSIQP
jgi:hypothetical protein